MTGTMSGMYRPDQQSKDFRETVQESNSRNMSGILLTNEASCSGNTHIFGTCTNAYANVSWESMLVYYRR